MKKRNHTCTEWKGEKKGWKKKIDISWRSRYTQNDKKGNVIKNNIYEQDDMNKKEKGKNAIIKKPKKETWLWGRGMQETVQEEDG